MISTVERTQSAAREIDLPDIVSRDVMCMVRDGIIGQPRNHQVELGPSELGMPCARRLIHKLSGHDPPGSGLPWKPYIGTAMHSAFEAAIRAHGRNQGAQPRFLTEHRVLVGSLRGGRDIVGTADVFDIDSGTVIDWKFVGKAQMQKYALRGPGRQYRTQAHLYGRGFARAGYVVRQVMILFLPREGELHITPTGQFTGAVMWAEPYDEQIAVKALNRVSGLIELLEDMEPADLIDLYPKCDDYFCPWCGGMTRPTTTIANPTTAELFGQEATAP